MGRTSAEIVTVDPMGLQGPEKDLLGFFLPGEVSRAVKISEWQVVEMYQVLTEIARDPDSNPRDKMAAIKMMNDHSREALSLGGIIQKVTAHAIEKKDGITKEVTAEGMRVITDASDRTLSTLQRLALANTSDEIIDLNEEAADADQQDTPVLSDVRCRQPSRTTGGDAGRVGGGGGSGFGDDPSVYGRQRATQTGPLPAEGHDDKGGIGSLEAIPESDATGSIQIGQDREHPSPANPGSGATSSKPSTPTPSAGGGKSAPKFFDPDVPELFGRRRPTSRS